MLRRSLAGRLAGALALTAAFAAAATVIAARWLPPLPAALIGFAAALLPALWLARQTPRRWVRVLQALRDGIVSLRDRDFSVSVAAVEDAELSGLIGAYNSLGEVL